MTDRFLVSFQLRVLGGGGEAVFSAAARQQLYPVFLQPIILLFDSILHVATKLLKFILSAFPGYLVSHLKNQQ